MEDVVLYSDAEHGALNDIGNALRLADRFDYDLRYVPTHGWLRFSGYKMDVLTGEPLDEGTILPDLIRGEVNINMTAAQTQEHIRWAEKSSSVGRIKAALEIMSDLPTVRAKHEHLNRDPFDFNTSKGIYTLNNGMFRECVAQDLMTKGSPYSPAPPAEAPTWLRFLEQVIPSKDVRAFLQRAVGYSMTGLTREEVFFMLIGDGQNGKSKFLSTIAHVLGSYSHTFDPKMIMQQKYEGHPTNIASLHGVRFAYTNEIGQGSTLDEERVKAITGGDQITARFMRKDEFSWTPSHKLWIATNYLPVIKGTDSGMWRRVLVVPFEVQIPDSQRDNMLAEKLIAEARGILGWCMDGAEQYFKHGLEPPIEVQMASAQYRQEQNSVMQFIEERCVRQPGARTKGMELYTSYKKWCEDSGSEAVSLSAFGRDLGKAGFYSVNITGGYKGRADIALLPQSYVV